VLPPASALHLALFVPAVAGSFLLMGALNFMVGTCAIHLESILALIRAKLWLIELLSGVLLPMTFFPGWAQAILRWLPFEHIAFSPLQIYLGRVGPVEALILLLIQWAWVATLSLLGALWWRRSIRQITIHGG
jgi:ABC-2 type transport system permease protein